MSILSLRRTLGMVRLKKVDTSDPEAWDDAADRMLETSEQKSARLQALLRLHKARAEEKGELNDSDANQRKTE